MLGLDARVDGVSGNKLHKLFIRILVQLGADDSLVGVGDDPELFADRHGGILVVAGDHDRADPGDFALFDGLSGLRTAGVDHPIQADQGQGLLKRGGTCICRHRIIGAAGGRQDAQRLIRPGLVDAADFVPDLIRHGDRLPIDQNTVAALQNHVTGALGVLNEAVFGPMHGGHHLAHGIKGCFGNAGLGLGELVFRIADLIGIVDKRGLGGLPFRLLRIAFQLGVRAEGHGLRHQARVIRILLNDRHFVLGQRAGLVAADDLGAAEGFHRGQLADQGLLFGHLRHADGQHDGNHRREAFRDRRHRQRDRRDEAVHGGDAELFPGEGLAGKNDVLNNAHGKDHHTDADDQLGQEGGELVHPLLQRRLFLLGLAQGPGDLAHLGIHARGGDHSRAASVNHGGPAVEHILSVAERDVVAALIAHEDIDELLHRAGFTGQGGLLRLQAVGLQHAAVGGHGIARFKADDVAHYQILALDGDQLTVAKHAGSVGGHLLQRFHGGLGLALLHDGHDGVDNDDRQDDKHIREGAERKVPLGLQDRDDNLHHGRSQQDHDHRVCERLEDLLPHRGLFRPDQDVFPVLLQPCGGLPGAQALLGAFQLTQDLVCSLKSLKGSSRFLRRLMSWLTFV